MMRILPDDVIILPARDGRWIALNVFARTAIGLDTAGLGALRDATALSPDALAARHEAARFAVWEIYRFPFREQAVANPACFPLDGEPWPPALETGLAGLLERCAARFILIEREAEYLARFAPKQAEVDTGHFGDFRQQLVQDTIVERLDRHNWWMDQKYTADRKSLLENSYKYVQEYNLKRYFSKELGPAMTVIDVGCGTGHYTNLMAETAAAAIGIDPNKWYLEIARSHARPNARFEMMSAGTPDGLKAVPGACADMVFMSDAYVMFYKDNYFPSDLGCLYDDLRRILKTGGKFVICEPHPVFLHQPWLGSAERPFTVLTEYRHKTYGIAGTFEWHVKTAAENGFGLVKLEEFGPDPAFAAVNPRGHAFARQFPLWALYEFRPLA